MIPIIILLVFIVGGWKIANEINAEVNRVNAVIVPKIALAKAEVEKVRLESQRLADEIAKIKNQGAEAADEIKRSIEPIRQSLYAISGTLRALSKGLETILNSLVKTINKLPKVNIKKVNLPDIKIPGLHIPKIDFDANLNFDMAAIEALKSVGDQIVQESEHTLDAVVSVWNIWWWTIKTTFYLLAFWIVLSLVGIVARYWRKFILAIQLISGREKSASLQML